MGFPLPSIIAAADIQINASHSHFMLYGLICKPIMQKPEEFGLTAETQRTQRGKAAAKELEPRRDCAEAATTLSRRRMNANSR